MQKNSLDRSGVAPPCCCALPCFDGAVLLLSQACRQQSFPVPRLPGSAGQRPSHCVPPPLQILSRVQESEASVLRLQSAYRSSMSRSSLRSARARLHSVPCRALNEEHSLPTDALSNHPLPHAHAPLLAQKVSKTVFQQPVFQVIATLQSSPNACQEGTASIRTSQQQLRNSETTPTATTEES